MADSINRFAVPVVKALAARDQTIYRESMMQTAEELKAIREIFFLSSSRQSFATPEDREKFFATWTGYYFKNCGDLIFLDRDGNGKTRGYLMGADNSGAAADFYRERLKSYNVFADQFARFPAHLHINVHPTARSQGVGARLIAAFEKTLRTRNVPGVHIVTSPDSANREFYARNGFQFEIERQSGDYPLLFMGKELK